MKFNKWTLGLAAVGAVSLASAVRADEAKVSQLQTALSNTTISGYVDVGAQYNTGNQAPVDEFVPAGTSANKVDQFSLNDVDIALDKPEDDSPWTSGYHIDLNVGNDAVGIGNAISGSGAIRQAYVIVRTPVGNGIDWKIGVQDDIIGYEGNTDSANPNYTRSVGYFFEPTTLNGIVGSYAATKTITVQAGVVNATSGNGNLSNKSYVGAIAYTAPDSWGWAKGTTINAGAVLNLDKTGQDNYYAGITLPTPWSPLKVGASFDLASVADEEGGFGGNPHNDSGWIVGGYANYQATDKLAFNLRGEFYDLEAGLSAANGLEAYAFGGDGVGEEITATVQYNLWANVTSRVEVRWDHADTGVAFGSGDTAFYGNSFILAANLIYTF